MDHHRSPPFDILDFQTWSASPIESIQLRLKTILPAHKISLVAYIELHLVRYIICICVHRVLKARILKWFAIPFSSGLHFVRTLHHDPFVLGGPTWHAHSFTELDKAVLHVIKLISFL